MVEVLLSNSLFTSFLNFSYTFKMRENGENFHHEATAMEHFKNVYILYVQ